MRTSELIIESLGLRDDWKVLAAEYQKRGEAAVPIIAAITYAHMASDWMTAAIRELKAAYDGEEQDEVLISRTTDGAFRVTVNGRDITSCVDDVGWSYEAAWISFNLGGRIEWSLGEGASWERNNPATGVNDREVGDVTALRFTATRPGMNLPTVGELVA
jgi:hypothetical protein